METQQLRLAEKMLPEELRWDEQAYKLIKEKGQIGAVLFCEEMIQDFQKQINEMGYYDGEKVSSLHDSIMNWRAILCRVKKGFPL